MAKRKREAEPPQAELECFDCGDEISESDAVMAGGEAYCDDCFDSNFTNCEACGDVVNDEETRYLSGNELCDSCYVTVAMKCNHCGDIFHEDTIEEVDGICFCETCFQQETFECDNCGDRCITNAGIFCNNHFTTSSGNSICMNCFENDYVECESCSEIVHRDSACWSDERDGHYCEDCYEESVSGIHDYSYKPCPIFHKGQESRHQNMYFGVELEVESRGNNMQSAVDRVYNFGGDLFYLKSDSSIDRGFEVVSHPFTLDFMKSNFAEKWGWMSRLRKQGFRSKDTTTCGMHVHISAAAFKSDLHLAKFQRLIYDYTDITADIAQRSSCSYATWEGERVTSVTRSSRRRHNVTGGRCSAVNLDGYCRRRRSGASGTVEVRLFKGTLSETGYQRNVEFCHAAVEFTRSASFNYGIVDFFNYITRNTKLYPNLAFFVYKKGWYEKYLPAPELEVSATVPQRPRRSNGTWTVNVAAFEEAAELRSTDLNHALLSAAMLQAVEREQPCVS